jgi:hypothetical protein
MRSLGVRQRRTHERIAYLLGAGFSANAQVPMMGGFFEAALDWLTDAGDAALRRQVAKIYGSLSELARHNLQAAYGEIEAGDRSAEWIPLLLETIGKAVTYPLLEISSCEELVTYASFVPPPGWKHKRPDPYVTVYDAFTSQILAANRTRCPSEYDRVVDLNYDLVFELSVNALGGRVCDPPAARRSSRTPAGLVPLIKPHGSVAWINQGNRIRALPAEVVLERTAKGSFEFGRSCILPPGFGRAPQEHGAFNVKTEHAIAATRASLQTADRVVIIGYSFPSSDIFFANLLKSAIPKHVPVEVYDVVTGDARTELEQRIATAIDRKDVFVHADGLTGYVTRAERAHAA